jgi:hypothetical protein
MKKMNLLFSFLTCLFLSDIAFAAFASTTSEIFDSTSEATKSTSGSTKKLFSQNNQDRREQFVEQNFDRLQEQAARGTGAVLNDYVSLLGCKNSHASKAIQENYSDLFSGGKSQLLPRTEQMMKNNSAFAACEIRS